MKPNPVPHVTRRISRCGTFPLADGYGTQRNPEAFRFESTIKENIMKKEKTPRSFAGTLLGLLVQAHNASMRTRRIKAFIVCAFSAGIFIATTNAQPNVTWQAPVTISGPTDVSTAGALFGTWAPGDDYTGSGGSRSDYYPVNGVTFAAYGTSGANFGFSGSGINLDRYNNFTSPNTGDANY